MARWLWRITLGLWFVPGALVVFLTSVTWKSSPPGDIDYDPAARLFYAALAAWVTVAIVLFVSWLLYRGLQRDAALRADVEPEL